MPLRRADGRNAGRCSSQDHLLSPALLAALRLHLRIGRHQVAMDRNSYQKTLARGVVELRCVLLQQIIALLQERGGALVAIGGALNRCTSWIGFPMIWCVVNSSLRTSRPF